MLPNDERMTVPDSLVTLDELAVALDLADRHVLAAELRTAGFETVEDVLGRPALSVATAKRFLQHRRDQAAAADRHSTLWDAYLAACKQWEDNRLATVQRGALEAFEKAGPGIQEARAAKLRGQVDAGRHYERTVPRPEWNGEPGWGGNARLAYLTEDELSPVVGRARTALRDLSGRQPDTEVA